MKRISIIGIGMSVATTTIEGYEAIRLTDELIGAKRMLEAYSELKKTSHEAFLPDEVEAIIDGSSSEHFAVLVSGDVGFYSGATKLIEKLSAYDVRLIPGISSMNYFFAKCGIPWQGAALISCHGIDTDIVSTVRRNQYTFALTGGNIAALSEALSSAGFNKLTVLTGENLGYPEERIACTNIESLKDNEYAGLTVLLIENGGYDARIRTGIPDSEFKRTDIPMTKSEVRAVCLSKLAIRPTDICYDIGCGTGSVTVELALSSYRGLVYSIDKSFDALALTKENCAAFHIGNVIPVIGLAPKAFYELSSPDAAFIGGSSGNMKEIVRALYNMNPHIRIVITAVSIESVYEAIAAIEDTGCEADVVQLCVSRTRHIAGLHMLSAQNSIFIIGLGKE
ncbi:MAG: precorrin-6y C5,15-methyltransferase (decarboxylating) subunit CbiE [Clostridia bacterium]